MSFEGSEKRLEIDFVQNPATALGLRQIPRCALDAVMTLTRCSIISSRHTAEVDAYVLSESSLFIKADTFILKTCGRTQILNGLSHLLNITEALGMKVWRVKYSRASFLFPQAQRFPHQSFDTEVAQLNKHFGQLHGACYVLGNQSRGLQWHLYYAAEKGMKMTQGCSLELCLTGLNPVLAQRFVQTEGFVDARTTTYETGIADLFPDAVLDDYVFEPCGYSMNGLSKNGILTIHVTPETSCSYASVEFCCLKPHAISLETVLSQVAQIFDPKDIHVALHCWSPQDLVGLKEGMGGVKGFDSDGLTIQYLSDGSQVLFKSNVAEALDSPRTLNTSHSFSTRSDEVSLCEMHSREDSQSSLSSEDKLWSLLPPLMEKRYDIQNVGSMEMGTYLRDLIQSKQLQQTFYVMNLSIVQRLYLTWRHRFPRVEPYYAVKCNPDPVLIRLLASLGAGFDCASRDEIKLVMDLGVRSDRIIFANACKHPADIRAAANHGVQLTTFDTPFELEKIKNEAPRTRALLRIRADDPEARCLLGNKYGVQMSSLPGLFQKAKDMEVDVVGVSFHVGSGATNPEAYSSAIALARQAFDLGIEYGFQPSILDIGGGFCSGKVDTGMTEFEAVQCAVNAALDVHFPVKSGIKIIAEPGRYFAETCATLSCYIIGRRERVTSKGIPLRDYWITDGLYGSFNCILYDHTMPKAYPLQIETPESTHGGYYSSTVFGPTCDGLDTVLADCLLPDLGYGDWLVFPDMGAYTLAGASNFNGMNSTDVKVYYVWADFDEAF